MCRITRVRQNLSFFSLIFFVFFQLFCAKSFALTDSRSFPGVEYPWRARYDIRLSNCPAVFKIYRCFPDMKGDVENDPEYPCDGVVPDYFHGCRRLDYFKEGSEIKVTSIHDEDGNDITHDINICFEKPSQCFLGIVMKNEENIGYIPIVNVFNGGDEKVFFDDIKGQLSFLQRNIWEEREYFLKKRRSEKKKIQSLPDSEKTEDREDRDVPPVEIAEQPPADSKGTIKYEKCHDKNDYLERLLVKDPMSSLGGFIGGLPRACTYAALKTGIKGHRHCVGEKAYYRKESPCLSEAYHKVVHNSLMLVSRCVGIDEKILFDLFNTESSLHLSVSSHSSAGGPAQLTEIFIEDVNQRLLDQTVDWTREACLQIKAYLPLQKMSPKKICERLPSSPGNSLRNMFYGAIGFRDIVNQLVVIYALQEEGGGNLHSSNISNIYNQFDSDTRKIIIEAAMYAYNHGITSLKDYFEEFVAKYGGIRYANFTGSQGQWLDFLVLRTSSQSDKGKEFLNYIYQTSTRFPGYQSNTVEKVANMGGNLQSLNVSLDECSYY